MNLCKKNRSKLLRVFDGEDGETVQVASLMQVLKEQNLSTTPTT